MKQSGAVVPDTGAGLHEWLEAVRAPAGDVAGAAFDTRGSGHPLLARWITPRGPRKSFSRSSARGLVAPPEHFCVVDTRGPLVEGEEQRARAWGAPSPASSPPIPCAHDSSRKQPTREREAPVAVRPGGTNGHPGSEVLSFAPAYEQGGTSVIPATAIRAHTASRADGTGERSGMNAEMSGSRSLGTFVVREGRVRWHPASTGRGSSPPRKSWWAEC